MFLDSHDALKLRLFVEYDVRNSRNRIAFVHYRIAKLLKSLRKDYQVLEEAKTNRETCRLL